MAFAVCVYFQLGGESWRGHIIYSIHQPGGKTPLPACVHRLRS